jgi:hypothetical protein
MSRLPPRTTKRMRIHPQAPHLFGVLLALGAALASATARAEAGEAPDASASRIAELNEAGTRAYANRNYRAAIEKFVEAYAIDPDPNLLFNIARAYEKLGELDAAIEKYETFVAAPGADTEGRLKAKASLAELRQLRDAGGASTARPEGEAPASDGSSAPLPATRILPWVTLGTGVVLTGAGVTLYALGARDHGTVTKTPGYGDPSVVYPVTRAEAQAYVDSGDTKKLVGGIGMGVGGALVVTGFVLLLTGNSATASSEAARVTLSPSRDGLYAGYAGRF